MSDILYRTYTFSDYWHYLVDDNKFLNEVVLDSGALNYCFILSGKTDDVTQRSLASSFTYVGWKSDVNSRACVYRVADDTVVGGYKYYPIGGRTTSGNSDVSDTFASQRTGFTGYLDYYHEGPSYWYNNNIYEPYIEAKASGEQSWHLFTLYNGATPDGYSSYNNSYTYEGAAYYYREGTALAYKTITETITEANWSYKVKCNMLFGSKEDALEYIRTGDASKRITTDSVDYTLYVDYTQKSGYYYNSSFKLTWDSDVVETSVADSKLNIYCTIYDTSTLSVNELIAYAKSFGATKSTDFTEGNITFSYSEMWEWCKDTMGTLPTLLRHPMLIVFNTLVGTEEREAYCVIEYRDTTTTGLITASDVTTSDTTLVIQLGQTGEDDDGYSGDDEEDDAHDDTGDDSFDTSGTLVTTYAMTKARLQALGGFIWNNSLFDDIKLWNNSPIENIVSIKAFPFSLGTDDDDVAIQLGNITSTVSGRKLSSSSYHLDIGSVTVPKKYNSFLDYAPYTSVAMHLPYIGFVELDTNLIMGTKINVYYNVDLITGACKAYIVRDSDNDVYYEFDGQMGIDVPITSSNRSQVEASYISAGIGLAVSAATLGAGVGAIEGAGMAEGIKDMMITNNVGTAIRGGTESLLSAAQAQYHYTSSSGGSPNVMSADGANRDCYVLVNRPTRDIPDTFNHTHGRMCNLSLYLGGSGCTGYTVCDSHIGLKGINATLPEKNELVSILSSGFFI